MEEKETADRG